MIKLCVFDLDGTLLDTVPDLTAAMNHAMEKTGHSRITTDQTREYIGNGIKMYAKRAMSQSYETDATDEEAETAVKYFKEYYSAHLINGTVPYPGMCELLAKLKSRGMTVETGRFQTHMEVSLLNDGPVTILLDSRRQF